jgi:Ca-activated chloride channel family protein
VFTQTIANLMPGATVRVRIEYVEPLPFADGRFEFSFPTVVGPRFVPPGVVDAARITPPVTPKGTRAGHDISIRVDVDAGVPIEAIESPLHQVDVRRDGPHRARVRLRRGREIPNRDFVLRYRVAGEGVRSTHLVHRSEGSGDGYVTFVLVPPARVTAETAAPKIDQPDRACRAGRRLLLLRLVAECVGPQSVDTLLLHARRGIICVRDPAARRRGAAGRCDLVLL